MCYEKSNCKVTLPLPPPVEGGGFEPSPLAGEGRERGHTSETRTSNTLKSGAIILKTPSEIAVMREANLIVAEILERIGEMVRPGVTTGELDKLAEKLIRAAGAKAAFKGYRMQNQKPYPASVCSSVNEQVVHGIPGNRALKEGDIVGVDVGVVHKGYVGDAARTYPIGEISSEAEKLLKVTRESLYKGIESVWREIGCMMFQELSKSTWNQMAFR